MNRALLLPLLLIAASKAPADDRAELVREWSRPQAEERAAK